MICYRWTSAHAILSNDRISASYVLCASSYDVSASPVWSTFLLLSIAFSSPLRLAVGEREGMSGRDVDVPGATSTSSVPISSLCAGA